MDTITKGLIYIGSAQQSDGSFRTFSSPSERPFVQKTPYVTTFAQALILASITTLRQEPAMAVRRRLASWLLKQRSESWSFNYWPRGSAISKRLPYPDDLDDTFCALLGLWLHDPTLVDAACLGKVVKLLIATERQTGGPYRTWLVPTTSDPVWQDVDVAVNSNVAGFLQLAAGSLPNVTAFMGGAIAYEKLVSPYYPSLYPIAYYLARAYRGPLQPHLAQCLLKQAKNGYWETPLQTALAVSSLIHLGQGSACAKAVRYLRISQQADGSWPAEAFCIDPAQQGQRFYNGAPVLTTAFVLEALARYEKGGGERHALRHAATQPKTRGINDRIYAAATAELSLLDKVLAAQCLAMLADVKKSDQHHEITLLPAFFKAALKSPPAWATDEKLVELGKANLYGWMAYTIYDDFLDNEGRCELLSVANTTLRRSLSGFRACLPDHPTFQQLTERTFDSIDSANMWEIANCRLTQDQGSITIARLPRYGQRIRLAERSLGHTLTPLAIVSAAGLEANHPSVRCLRRGLAHYLIARQLNDDLHDWESDLREGNVSYVVCELLRQLRLQPGTYLLSELVPRLQRRFWHHSLKPLCATMTRHITQARQAFAASGLLTSSNEFFSLLDRVEASVERTLSEQADAKAFLESYSKR